MPNATADQLMTSPQVAVLLGCSPRTVHRLVIAGRLIPARKLTGPNGAFLFDPATVDAYRRERSAERGATTGIVREPAA